MPHSRSMHLPFHPDYTPIEKWRIAYHHAVESNKYKTHSIFCFFNGVKQIFRKNNKHPALPDGKFGSRNCFQIPSVIQMNLLSCTPNIIFPLLLSLTITIAKASDKFETWVTEITCDQQHFTLTSYCKPSKKAFTMNSCRSDQVLAKAGQKPVALPLAQTRAINKDLRATRWKCLSLNNVSYLEIDYAAGLGNIPKNEATEHYALNLSPITDESLELNIMRKGIKTSKGFVRSIMPDGDLPQGASSESYSRLDLITNITRNPAILEKKWGALKDIFTKCKKNSNDIALTCEQIDGIREITLIEGPTGSSTIEFNSPATCEEIYRAVSKNIGKGTVNGDYCDAEWNLKRIKKGLSASLYNSPKNPSRIFFMIGFEQGP